HDAGMRQMTLDAGRGVAMAALEPRVVLLVHDVAVHARARIGRQVGEALRVDEGERAHADRNPQQADEGNDKPRSRHGTTVTGKADPRGPARERVPDRAARPIREARPCAGWSPAALARS